MDFHAPNICAIIVTYHPDLTLLHTLLEKTYPQVTKLVIVNNTATTELETQLHALPFYQNITIITPSQNLGLGAAHNTGIAWAKKNNFDYVLLFDQDSCPADDMVINLYNAHQKLVQENKKVAVVGPNHVDIRTKISSYAVQLDGFKIKKCYCVGNEYIPAAHIITSGSLISLQNFDEIGQFDETLFIDYVDIEWGLRALSKGYQSWYICSAILHHRLGDNLVSFLGRKIPFYSPLRCFYTFRNAILLCKKKYIPLLWKLRILFQSLQRYVFYLIQSSTKLQHIKMMSLGIWDGLMGRTGKL